MKAISTAHMTDNEVILNKNRFSENEILFLRTDGCRVDEKKD